MPLLRLKAFIVDMFMIMMPLAYVLTYIVLGGKDEFLGSINARWLVNIVYGVITIVLWSKLGQTPGMKAYNLKVVLENGEKLSFFHSFNRYLFFVISMVLIAPMFYIFFNDEKKSIWDILSKSKVINE